MKRTIGVSDMYVSNKIDDILVTYALGSCIGLAIHDPIACVGGILHYMLPVYKTDNGKVIVNPFMYGDTGIPELFLKAYKLGAKKEHLCVIMAGGAEFIKNSELFNIGSRNIAIARKIFWKSGIMITAEQTGGKIPRTLYLEIGSGKSWITTGNQRTNLT